MKRIRRIRRQVITGHIQPERVRVLQLDPVGCIAILIFQRAFVIGQKLTDLRRRERDIHTDRHLRNGIPRFVRCGQRVGRCDTWLHTDEAVGGGDRPDPGKDGRPCRASKLPSQCGGFARSNGIVVRGEDIDVRDQSAINFDLRGLRIISCPAVVHDSNETPCKCAAGIVCSRDGVHSGDSAIGAIRAQGCAPLEDSCLTAIVGVDFHAIIRQPFRATTVRAIAQENAIQLIRTAQINFEVIIQSAGRGEWMRKGVGVAIREGRGDQVSPGCPGRGHRLAERQIRLWRFLRDRVRGKRQKLRKNDNPPEGRGLEHKRPYSTNEAG